MHNYHRLVKGKPRCTLKINPADAHSRGLEDGDQVVIESRVGQVSAALEVSEELMPGVVSLPHGWGHGRAGTQMDIAAKHAGVSCNDLTDASQVDRLSGNAVLNGVPVTVRIAS
jgi:anaerobic selenocysteine-containing dehydrogenase